MATLTNFGEQFAAKTLGKVYAEAIFPSIVNRNYEGEIQKPGDRVNILSFLNNILLSDYSVGSDMSSETIVDAEDVLVVEKRKYYNFSLDRLEDLFTYASDIPANLLENASYVLKNTVDTYVLEKAGSEAKAGNWVAFDLQVIGGAVTMASIVTTSTGGTVTLVAQTASDADTIAGVELIDGTVVHAGFEACDVGKGFRLRSTATLVSPWYRISSVTSSVSAALTEWDGATSGSDFWSEIGATLRGMYLGDGKSFPRAGTGEQHYIGMANLGWEIQAAYPTAISASSIYDQITVLAEKLNAGDVPLDNRHLVVPEEIVTQLKQASETQPTGISEIYTGTVINGRFMRMGGFDIHMATGSRLSSRIGKALGNAGSATNSSSATGYLIPALHTAMITFADKWSESRVVDAENQFAKKYQGLFLFGAKVPAYSRKFGAILYGNF